jgi:tRNA (guanine-N7-)-methyltransferase
VTLPASQVHASSARAFWRELFGSEAPVEIEIGSGDGTFLMARAAAFPARNFLGIERSPSRARRLAERVARRDLPNVRTLQADATCLMASLIPAASVGAVHVYFPDPWPKRGHAHRRIFTAAFAAALARALEIDGRLFVATDVVDYASVARDHVLATGSFREIAARGEHPGLTTSFARKYRVGGRTLYPFTFVRVSPAAGGQACAASKMRSM